ANAESPPPSPKFKPRLARSQPRHGSKLDRCHNHQDWRPNPALAAVWDDLDLRVRIGPANACNLNGIRGYANHATEGHAIHEGRPGDRGGSKVAHRSPPFILILELKSF